MAVSDTLCYPYFIGDTVSCKPNYGIYWRYGYEVIENKGLTAVFPPIQPIYLDEKKKKLSYSIVVWQVKYLP